MENCWAYFGEVCEFQNVKLSHHELWTLLGIGLFLCIVLPRIKQLARPIRIEPSERFRILVDFDSNTETLEVPLMGQLKR